MQGCWYCNRAVCGLLVKEPCPHCAGLLPGSFLPLQRPMPCSTSPKTALSPFSLLTQLRAVAPAAVPTPSYSPADCTPLRGTPAGTREELCCCTAVRWFQQSCWAGAGHGAAHTEHTLFPHWWCSAAPLYSPSFPFFPCFSLTPPAQPQLPACGCRVRRPTHIFQSPRLAVGPAHSALPAPALAGRPGSCSSSPRDGENNKKYQICRRNAGDTVAGGPGESGQDLLTVWPSPRGCHSSSPVGRLGWRGGTPWGPCPTAAPVGHSTPDGSRTPPHRRAENSSGSKAAPLTLLINHICRSCFERQIRTDAVLRELFTAELVAYFELRHLRTCSWTLLGHEEKPVFHCKESTRNSEPKALLRVHVTHLTLPHNSDTSKDQQGWPARQPSPSGLPAALSLTPVRSHFPELLRWLLAGLRPPLRRPSVYFESQTVALLGNVFPQPLTNFDLILKRRGGSVGLQWFNCSCHQLSSRETAGFFSSRNLPLAPNPCFFLVQTPKEGEVQLPKINQRHHDACRVFVSL